MSKPAFEWYTTSMKLGIVLQSNKDEHAWNTFRLGLTALKAGHEVEVFLMNEGAELDSIEDTADFDISAKVSEFKEQKGAMYVCGSCLKVRGLPAATSTAQAGKEGAGVCPIPTMS